MAAPPPPLSDRSDPLRILLIEDEAAHVVLIERAFVDDERDFHVLTAQTVKSGVEALRSFDADLILADWRLPDGEGTDLLHKAPGLDCPVIVMTGHGDEKTAVAALRSGALDYVVKSDIALASMPQTVVRGLREWGLIKERQRLEDELHISQKMEAIGRLAGGIAHDFNNLLTVIGTYAEFALEETDPDKLKENLREIIKAQERAAALTGQLLAFGGRQAMTPVPVDVNESILGVGRMMRRVIGEHYPIHLNLEDSLGSVLADPSQLEQVIVNLLVNARDAMPSGGSISISTRRVELEAPLLCAGGHLPSGGYLRLDVADSGTGMPDDVKLRIFDPFFTTKHGGGTGLGLSSAFGIVHQLGGDIAVDTIEGQGTTFSVYLRWDAAPTVLAQEEEDEGPTPGPEDLSGTETILLAEDDSAIRKLVLEMLGRRGYTVLVAENGEEALTLARNHKGKVDLLLSDVVMPRRSGFELALDLQAEIVDLKTLFISGYLGDSLPPEELRNPRTRFLSKPFSTQALLSGVRELLDEIPQSLESSSASSS
jgi:two-component system, cell cycle sensor histidine kinase and response regulator CckA